MKNRDAPYNEKAGRFRILKDVEFFLLLFYKSYTIAFKCFNISLLSQVTVVLNLTLPSLEVKQVVLLS